MRGGGREWVVVDRDPTSIIIQQLVTLDSQVGEIYKRLIRDI